MCAARNPVYYCAILHQIKYLNLWKKTYFHHMLSCYALGYSSNRFSHKENGGCGLFGWIRRFDKMRNNF